MRVSVIGTGYVGLVSGTCFAEIGHDVTCIDIDPKKIAMLEEGKSPIYEPGLEELLHRNIKSKRLKFSTNYDSVKEAKSIFLAVGTPSSDDGSANLTYLKDAALSVAKEMSEGAIIVIKSTVPVGTCEMIQELVKNATNKKFHIVNNPEFLKEGTAVDDFMKPDRVVIGHADQFAADAMSELYAPLVRQGNPIYMMSNLSAEMTKYAANCFLATKISFINEIAKLCDLRGADINEVRDGIGSDRRIGNQFLYPGPGYGGSCFPKDVKALMYTAKESGMTLKVVEATEEVNEEQKKRMFEKIMSYYGDVSGKTFTFWGVAFKANTDDIRETSAITMAKELIRAGAKVNYYDPEAANNFEELMESMSETKGGTTKFENKYDALTNSDGLVTMTEWREFTSPDFEEIKARLNKSVIFDSRNLYKTKTVLDHGFDYFAIGKRIAK
ncbi:UDP-glucose/GDP-mannose dehydrogenase family protein [Halobacteriovorax sp. JY17]|uniref:UDP-glucose dehydrogenase family protein n=1 Tax=Halobacteriovorax sp. JY17 TaxID=2014617 RepID=UPI000C6A4273|nr:UDP-glucose/GDP-mannose dehydrogenase family protein [Halobacteriovorax sp. JY17]PIK13878.1 MAG: UDP-glucose 6-dehydrogenase [Halobacteriovorax sp. JY17]